MELEHKVYLAILACNLLHCYIIPLSVQDSNSLDSLPRTWHKAVGAVQVQLVHLHVVDQMDWPCTTTPLVRVYT